jgi:hypothetical protein
MIAGHDRPLLFLDVDGPLIPFRARLAVREFTSNQLMGRRRRPVIR